MARRNIANAQIANVEHNEFPYAHIEPNIYDDNIYNAILNIKKRSTMPEESVILEGIKIGADPELFLYNEKTNKVVSAVGIIPGEKGRAWRDEQWPKGFGLEIDNILAEYNIPPVSSRQDWLFVNNFMKNEIRKYIKNINPDLNIRHRASYIVDEDQLQSEVAKLFGCSKDYNVYTKAANPKPNGEATNLRSAGVHIHCSYPNISVRNSLIFIKYFDAYLGVPSVLIDPDTRRRELYGKAGCFRLCKYGFEYRTLSGYFIKDDDILNFVWDGILKAIWAYKNGMPLPKQDDVIEAINTSNKELAKKLCKDYNLCDSKYYQD